MLALALPWIIRGAAVLAVVAALWGAWYSVDNWCNDACREEATRADSAEGKLRDAQERATALALLWSESIQKVEKVYVERVEKRESQFADLRRRVESGTRYAAGSIRLAPDAVRLLDDAHSLANDSAPAQADQRAPEAVSETSGDEWVRFAVDAAEAYRDAADKHLACVNAWEQLLVTNESGPK